MSRRCCRAGGGRSNGLRRACLEDSAADSRASAGYCLQDRFGLRFPLIHASAEQAPFADASFDLAILEYGASAGAATRYPFVTLDWARQWPCEEVWKARKSS